MLLQHALYDWFSIDSGRQNCGGDRQTVFSTAVDPKNKNWLEQEELDLTKPRLAVYKQAWKVSQDAVYWVDICRAQRMRSKLFQSRSHAIILYDTLPPICFEKVVSRKTEEVFFSKLRSRHVLHRRLPYWQKDGNSDALVHHAETESVQGLSEVVVVRGRCNEVCVFLCAQSSALRSSWCCEVAVSWRES